MITLLNLTVSSSNSVLLVSVGALAVWLWMRGAVTLGDIGIATGLALRVALMSGWVMWTSIGIFDNIGQVQEGMRTIARNQAIVLDANHHDGELSPPMMKGACGGVSGRVPVRETSSERSLLVWRSHPDS